ncbi:MAG: T9SS type A sorting domain-containing protein [Nonlabens sp.]
MRLFFLLLIFSSLNVKGQFNDFLDGITPHIWNLEQVNDNGTIYTYDNFNSGSGPYYGGMDNMSGTIMSVNYCSGFYVTVNRLGNRSFSISSNFTMRGSNCSSQAEQIKNDALINAFVDATRTNGVATFNYRFEGVFSRLIITTPDNIEITFFQSTLSNKDQLAQEFETYYNQSTEELIISSPSTSENFKLNIFDLSGKMILSETHDQLPNTFVDLRSFKNGMYIAVLENSSGKKSLKFVK